jgi:hypothetical protein
MAKTSVLHFIPRVIEFIQGTFLQENDVVKDMLTRSLD